MINLSQVREFHVASNVVCETERSLLKAGRRGYERFVLWSGVILDELAHLRTAHVPRQTSYKTRDGLLVRVPGDALHQLNVWLYENNETLVAQIHAHPTDAYHSDTDDTYPIVTTLGGLSIVVPDFAQHGVACSGTVVYRLVNDGWLELPNALGTLLRLGGNGAR